MLKNQATSVLTSYFTLWAKHTLCALSVNILSNTNTLYALSTQTATSTLYALFVEMWSNTLYHYALSLITNLVLKHACTYTHTNTHTHTHTRFKCCNGLLPFDCCQLVFKLMKKWSILGEKERSNNNKIICNQSICSNTNRSKPWTLQSELLSSSHFWIVT